MQVDFREWIKVQTADKVAGKLKVDANTVYSWSHRNRIPYRLWPEVVLAFSEISLSDLMAMEKASRQ